MKPRWPRRAACCALALLLGAPAAYSRDEALPMAADLRQSAAQALREGKPVLVLFTLPGCGYCEVIRRNYLAPLLREGGTGRIVEVDITSIRPLTGFDGQAGSQRSFAAGLNVSVAPTLMFFGPSGQQLAAPIVGGDAAGMYGAYLDARMATAILAMSRFRDTSPPKSTLH